MLHTCHFSNHLFQKHHQCGGQLVGGHVVRYFLLPYHICPDIPQRSVHQASSRGVADSIWLQRTLSDGSAVLAIPKLQDSQEDPDMGRSGFSFLPHRHGQGVWRQLFGRHGGKDLESFGRVCAGALPRLGLQGHSDSTSRYPLGHQHHVGGDGDCLCSLIAKLYRVLVGRVNPGRYSV